MPSNLGRTLRGVTERLPRRRPSLGSTPNILFFLTDQQRWDAVGYASDWLETPTIDGLAREGVRFTNAYTNAPVCVPARLSLAIGRYPHEHRVWDNRRHTMSPNATTWMQGIRDAGYRTCVIGKTHLYAQKGDLREQEWLLNAYGLEDVEEVTGATSMLASNTYLKELWRKKGVFKAWKQDVKERKANKRWVARPSPVPLELYPDTYVGRRAVEYLSNYDHDQPWFCWVSFPGPHDPWDAPEPYASRYDPADMPPPVPTIRSRHPELQGFLHKRLADQIPFEEGEVAALRANYAGNVTLIDDQIRDVLRVVEERGELDNTFIVFASDHGEMNGDHGVIAKKTFLNGAMRIPLVMKPPPGDGWARGAVHDGMVELMDLGATMLAVAGGKQASSSHALDVLPALRDPSHEVRGEVVAGLRKEVMIATQRWKLAVNRDGVDYFLVDLEKDPDESENVAGDPAYDDVIEDLRARVRKSSRGSNRHVRKRRVSRVAAS